MPEAEEHFPQLTKAQKEHERPNESFEEFISVLDSLIKNYNKKFKDFEKHDNCLKLTFMPHLVDIPSAPANLKMELIKLSEENQGVKPFKITFRFKFRLGKFYF